MEYSKDVLISNKNYKITYYANKDFDSKKCVITFGEISSNLNEEPFGSKLLIEEGFDYIYVAQKRSTQYQFLSGENFKNIVSPYLTGKEVYTYGSSLGGYCAIYYGGVIDAKILSMSPRIPAHPVIDRLMDGRFKNMGFKHKELENSLTSSKRVCIFYDRNNYIDNYYIDFYIKQVYPNAEYHHIQNAGHYTARALLVSKELKKIALNFLNNKEINFILDTNKILEWHIDTAKRRVNKGRLQHAHENLEVLLSSKKSKHTTVLNMVRDYKKKLNSLESAKRKKIEPKLYPILSNKEFKEINNSVTISYVGGLTLLEDQVSNAYNFKIGEHEFDDIFKYTTKFLQESDYSIGVLKGPAGGEKLPYSSGIFQAESSPLLNLPDTFIYSIKNAGFNFLTTAQNHLLDAGVDGAMRTLDILDKAGLEHSGSYRNMEEKEKLPIYKIKGLRVAILTFTKSSNGYNSSFFLKKNNEHLTSILVPPVNKNFEKVKKSVVCQFERVKEAKPDCILVLSHIGKRFSHSPDKAQKTWNDIFIDAGADVILNDHAHTVQPYEWRKKPDGKSYVLILNSSGDFANSDVNNNGDASALTQLYLDPSTGKPFAVACIPLWSHSYVDHIHRALPIDDVANKIELRQKLSTHDFSRLKEVHDYITKIMLGEKLSIDQIQEKYYLFASRSKENLKGYVRNPVNPLVLSKNMKSTEIYRLLSSVKHVCFLGDSITEGTKNGGYGWFEPLIENFDHLKVDIYAKGGANTGYLINNIIDITDLNAELYVIAIGTNDLLHYNSGEMTSKEFIENLRMMVEKINAKNNSTNFVFIAPWRNYNQNLSSKQMKEENFNIYGEFIHALKQYAELSGFLFIDPNPIINKIFQTQNANKLLKDHIHPNAREGIKLYSSAVLQASPRKQRRMINPLKYIYKKFKS